MSNALAIAAVSATMQALLMKGGIESVTLRSLDSATKNVTGERINLFLYQALLDAAFRNMDLPARTGPGETGNPPLPLILHYLLTAYGDEENDLASHRLLGKAMSILHDHPVLGAEEIRNATGTNVEGSDLHEQVERLRITLHPLTFEEMAKLWTSFQVHYRPSAAYQVSVVLIDSRRPARAPLPVLRRGEDDRGAAARTSLVPPLPALREAAPPDAQPAVRVGEILTLQGHHLEGDLSLRFRSLRGISGGPWEVNHRTASEIQVRLLPPDDPAETPWAAGPYTVAAVFGPPGRERTTNEVPFALAPQITKLPAEVDRSGEGAVAVTLTCRPPVLPGQRAALLLGDREVPAEPQKQVEDQLVFMIQDAPVGDHYVRLRVDGIDSLLVDRSVSPPIFDETQKVRIL